MKSLYLFIRISTLVWIIISADFCFSQSQNTTFKRHKAEQLLTCSLRRQIKSINVSPNQKLAAIEVHDLDNNCITSSSIWLYDLTKQTISNISINSFSNHSPQWTPNSTHILYLSDRAGNSILREFSVLNGSNSIIDDQLDIKNFCFGKTSSEILLFETNKSSNSKNAVSNSEKDIKPIQTSISSLNLKTKETQHLITTDFLIKQYTYSSKNDIFYLLTQANDEKRGVDVIYEFDNNSKSIRSLFNLNKSISEFKLSPSGKHFAYVPSTERYSIQDLVILDLETRQKNNISGKDITNSILGFSWVNDTSLACSAKKGDRNALFKVTINNKVRLMYNGKAAPSSLVGSTEAGVLFSSQSENGTTELCIYSHKTGFTKLTKLMASWNQTALASPYN